MDQQLSILLAKAKSSQRINEFELSLAKAPQQVMPVTHLFTPGLYARSIFMPKGTKLTSKIHKTEHPFLVSKGVVEVFDEVAGLVMIVAPFLGVTKPGTRRALNILEDTIWTTFHPTTETDLAVIEDLLIEPHDIPPLTFGGNDGSPQIQEVAS